MKRSIVLGVSTYVVLVWGGAMIGIAPGAEVLQVDLTDWSPPKLSSLGNDPFSKLVKYGHALVTDDLCAVDGSGTVRPAMSLLKIAERSLTSLPSPGMMIDVETEGERRLRFAIERLATAPLPLRALYLIDEGDEISAEPLRGSDAVLALVQHSYWQDLVGPELRGAILRQAGTLARSCRLFRLRRPRDLARIPSVAEWVERHSMGDLSANTLPR